MTAHIYSMYVCTRAMHMPDQIRSSPVDISHIPSSCPPVQANARVCRHSSDGATLTSLSTALFLQGPITAPKPSSFVKRPDPPHRPPSPAEAARMHSTLRGPPPPRELSARVAAARALLTCVSPAKRPQSSVALT